jgi:hypothetical protein
MLLPLPSRNPARNAIVSFQGAFETSTERFDAILDRSSPAKNAVCPVHAYEPCDRSAQQKCRGTRKFLSPSPPALQCLSYWQEQDARELPGGLWLGTGMTQ